MHRCAVTLFFALICVLAARPQTPAPGNAILIEDLGHKSRADRPFTISRVFAHGEIPHYAQAVIAGSPVPTQCDVKTRWPDGSVRHALLSFWAGLERKKAVQVDFVDQTEGSTEGALSKAEMLGFLDGKWNAIIQASTDVKTGSTASRSVSAREILDAWDGQESDMSVRYWLKGPIATQVIVEDKTKALPFDFGWQAALKPVRLATPVKLKDDTLQINAADAELLSAWQAPLMVYVGAEQINVCSISDTTLSVCRDGRGINDSRPAAHPSGGLVAPNQNWIDPPDDRYKSLHPVFVLTFYPRWEGLKIEYIVENVWTTRLQDQVYRAKLLLSPDNVAWENVVTHFAATRWRKTFWSGAEPGAVRVDHNLAYLSHTRAIPNYDRTLKINQAGIQSEMRLFDSSDQGEPLGSAQWAKVMPGPGGRGDLGILPRWHVRYLYTFDPNLERAMLGSAAASGHVPVHYRESLSEDRYFDSRKSATAFGRVVSIDARPTVRLRPAPYQSGDTKPADRMTPVGFTTSGGWQVDISHQPSMVYLPYLLTGDWYFREELYFWAAVNLAWGNPGICDFCRIGSMGFINGGVQPRSEAWGLRSLAQALWIAPQDTPEHFYFTEKLNNNIAVREGQFEVQDGHFYEPAPDCAVPCRTTRWRFGRDYIGRNIPNPLHFPEVGGTGDNINGTIDKQRVYAVGSPWQSNYLHCALGHIEELGFTQIAPLRRTLASNLIQQLQRPDFNPYLATEYRMPLKRLPDRAFFDNWADVRAGYIESLQNRTTSDRFGSVGDSYAHIVRAAASFMTGIIEENGFSGQKAYEWIHSQLSTDPRAFDPTWAFAPRASGGGEGSVAIETKRVNPSWFKVGKPRR